MILKNIAGRTRYIAGKGVRSRHKVNVPDDTEFDKNDFKLISGKEAVKTVRIKTKKKTIRRMN